VKTDTQIQHDVLAELEWDPSVEASSIGVASNDDGVVTLTGHVASFREKDRAEEIARRVCGVRAIANGIEVKLVGDNRRTDADIASATLSSLAWDTRVDEKRISVTVRDGWVTLEGSCDWMYQSEAATQDVRILSGVKGVTNKMKVIPPSRVADVQRRIEDAFRRSADLDARRVEIETSDGRIVLRGNVRSWTELAEAQHAAWSAPGVVQVDNRLVVTP
jgi:osmotically-inducible protein OsmY